MKKTLIAVAAFAAASSFAQSNVTIAGIVDQGFTMVSQSNRAGTQDTKQSGFGEGGWAGSRLRFSGEEGLGGGMKAVFWLEQGIAPSDGSGFNYRNGGNSPQMHNGAGMTRQNRQSYVGLAGGFGEVRLGRVYSATYDMYTNKGYINGEFTGTGNAGAMISSRTKGLSYQSPKMSGFDVYLTVGGNDMDHMDTTSTQDQVSGYKTKKTEMITGRLMYNAGKFDAGLSLEQNTESCTASGAALTNYYGAAVAVGTCTTGTVKSSSSTLLAQYDFGFAKVNGIIVDKRAQSLSTGTQTDTLFNQINVKVPLGAKTELRLTANTSKASTGTASDWSGNLVGLNYKFSNRTVGYMFSGSQTDSAATDAVTVKESRTTIGLAHTF